MPVNDGQERVTAFRFDLQLFAEDESGTATETAETTETTEIVDPLETLRDMKPIDGFESESQGDGEPKEEEPEVKPGDSGQEADKEIPEEVKREQSPEANEAFKKMRQEKEQAENQLGRITSELQKRFGITDVDQFITTLDNAQQQQAQTQNQDEVTAFFQQRYAQRLSALVNEGYDEGLADQLARMQTDQEYIQWERQNERTTAQQQRQQEAQESQKRQNMDTAMKLTMEQYGELKKDYPDLLPADCQDFKTLVEQLNPKVTEKMASGYLLEDAFKLVHFDDILSRASKRGAQQTLNSVNGRAHVKPSGGASEVETIAIPEDTLKMYKQLNPGRTHKEYLEHYKRSLKG